ncbi:MAG: zinc ABC transporter substrate-binding protein [Oscillospiraceae bacterium]|nr:zinc ABC transporter substrate-binding protein [Oscillospiraceae bacterium]
MKRFFSLFIITISILLSSCSNQAPAQIAATTLPVYEFTTLLCEGTGITVTRLVTEEVSCLHDYSLNVRQVKAAEAAELIVISGAGLEEFMEELLTAGKTIDASAGLILLAPPEGHDHDDHEGHTHEGHHHEHDPHIWLSPEYAKTMVCNIRTGLSREYPQYAGIFSANEQRLLAQLDGLQAYGEEVLSSLSCRELITFHDGFAYFADAFQLTILEAVEEESGSEASAKDLIHLIEEVRHHSLPAIFTEKSGSVSAASIIARETGCKNYALDMAMASDSYFNAMYHNINTIKEALE